MTYAPFSYMCLALLVVVGFHRCLPLPDCVTLPHFSLKLPTHPHQPPIPLSLNNLDACCKLLPKHCPSQHGKISPRSSQSAAVTSGAVAKRMPSRKAATPPSSCQETLMLRWAASGILVSLSSIAMGGRWC